MLRLQNLNKLSPAGLQAACGGGGNYPAEQVRVARIKSPYRERGVSLVEVIVSIGILAGLAAGVNQLTQNASEEMKTSVAALHTKTVGDAANSYIKDNYAAVLAVATATTPALIRISDLIATGYLPAGFAVTNSRGQSTCVLALEPSANNITGLVITTGGTTLDDITLGNHAAVIGGSGGGIYSTDPSTIRGAMGGWTTPVGAYANPNHLGQNCDGVAGSVTFTAGHPAMAIWMADTASASAALYRDAVPSNPGLNTMTTPLIMASVQTLNGACATTGSIASDSGGAVLSCQSGAWKSQSGGYWKDPVPNFASLPSSGNQTGDVRLTRDTNRTFAWNGGSWAAISVDQNGNLSVPGTITTGTVNASGTVNANETRTNESYVNGWFRVNGGGGIYWQNYGGGWYMSDGTWIRSYNDKSVYTGGVMRADGGFQVDGNQVITGDGYLNAVNTVSEGAGCSPNGLIAKDSTGLILSCQSGSWKKASGAGGFNAATVTTRVVAGTCDAASGGWACEGGYACTAGATCKGDEALSGCSGSGGTSWVSARTCYSNGYGVKGNGNSNCNTSTQYSYATCIK